LSENAEVVRRQFEALERGGLDAMVEFWHPEIDWRAVEGAADDAGVLHGRDRMRRYYEDWTETFETITTTVEEVLLDEGERLVVKLRVSGRGRASGAPADASYFVVYTIRDGLIVRGREYATAEEALER
jgi:ketosteroid isomerase-like protein